MPANDPQAYLRSPVLKPGRQQRPQRRRQQPARARVDGRRVPATMTAATQPATLPAAVPQPQAQAMQALDQVTAQPFQPFGPGNDLRSTQINPFQSPTTQRAGELAGGALESMFATPDRAQLAADALRLFEEQQADERRIGIQDIGREAATLGRIGSGVTTSQLGDLGLQLARERNRMERGLATEAAGQTLADRQARLAAALGTQGQYAGQEAGAREELRGERGFQQQMSQQALQDYINMLTLSESLAQGQFGRETTRLGQILGTGFNDPTSALISAANVQPQDDPLVSLLSGAGNFIGAF